MSNQLIKSMIILFLAQACVGLNIVLSKFLIGHINTLIILTVRFTGASIFMALILIKARRSESFILNVSGSDWVILFIQGVGAGVMFNFIMLNGLYYTDANSAGLIASLLPAMIIGLNVLVFKQRLTKKMLFSVAISIIGLIFINLGVAGNDAKNALLGNLIVLFALIPEALYYTLSKFHPIRMNLLLKALILNLVNLPVLYFMVIVSIPLNNWQTVTLRDWIIMVIAGMTTGLFFMLWQKGIQYVDSTYAALSTALMPIATVILSWIILGESLGVTKLIGMLVIVISILNYARR